MNIFNYFKEIIELELEAMGRAGELPGGLDTLRVSVAPPRDLAHGDLAANPRANSVCVVHRVDGAHDNQEILVRNVGKLTG